MIRRRESDERTEVGEFYPTRRGNEAPPEHVIGGGGASIDVSAVPDVPESGTTIKHLKETLRSLMAALKRGATVVVALCAVGVMAEASVTGSDGMLLEDCPTDEVRIIDAPTVKALVDQKADAQIIIDGVAYVWRWDAAEETFALVAVVEGAE